MNRFIDVILCQIIFAQSGIGIKYNLLSFEFIYFQKGLVFVRVVFSILMYLLFISIRESYKYNKLCVRQSV